MNELFGIPMETVSVILATTLAVALATVVALGLRNRVFLRLAGRNVARRRGRSALIVLGLMLGTTIIAAALATGDTMSQTLRSSAVSSLGQTDELVSVKGAEVEVAVEGGDATGVQYFSERYAARLADVVARWDLVDGATPAIVETVSILDPDTRQNEPRVSLFAADPDQMAGFGTMTASGDREVSLRELANGEVYLNRDAATELHARRGDEIVVMTATGSTPAVVRDIIDYDGTGAAGPGLILPLGAAQELLGREGQVRHLLVSNRGDEIQGAEHSDEVVRMLAPMLTPLGLEADTAKQDALEAADEAGNAFMSFFTTFGSFSIAAGLLLIFLIFVMLAAERRAELGIARAVGTRRGHLVQTFLFEGVAYDLLAAAVGALVGLAVAYGMVLVMANAFAVEGAFEMTYAVKPASVVTAYAIGVLLTFVVVSVSAWRVSRMNIVSAIRNLPEPETEKTGRRRWVPGLLAVLAGAALVVSGVSAKDALTLGFGVSLVILGLVPLARAAGVADRVARTAGGLALVLWFVLPIQEWLLGDLKMDFSIFILSGLMVVVGATWTIMYNADVLLGLLGSTLGRIRVLAPILKMSIAYPLRNLFRTGVTLAMFTLVVFTLVVGATTSGAFINAANDLEAFGGGFEVRATTAPATPIPDIQEAVQATDGVRPSDFDAVSSLSLLPAEVRQVGAEAAGGTYAVRGVDEAFAKHNTFGLATTAEGYESADEVWQALASRPGLAVVDATVVPRRANFSFGVIQDFALEGFYLEDQSFTPVPVEVRDPQTGRAVQLTIIGVLTETVPLEMAGIMTSQETMSATFGERVAPTLHLFSLSAGADATRVARSLEATLLPYGVEAEPLADVLADVVSGSLTFNRLIQGFMGLGLIVGVAALGVITARAVVERRQQIGVLRAVGFRRGMVQASFLLESTFVALTSIVVGTALGLAIAYNVISDSRQQPSWENLTFDVPWMDLAIIFVAVYAVALITTFAPAVRASRVHPAEALRYQ